MISVIIPTLNAETGLVATLSALVPATVAGVVREVIIVDGGSTDRTIQIAEDAGATVLTAPIGRGSQLRAGADRARQPWLLFLHADTVLEPRWEDEVVKFIARIETGARPLSAATFRFTLDDDGVMPRLLEAGVVVRCALFRLPYGDQGLLVPKRIYDEIGGYRPMPMMEDVEIVGRIGRRRLALLRARAITSAERYRQDGYMRRVLRNWYCFTLYKLGVPIERIMKVYYRSRPTE